MKYGIRNGVICETVCGEHILIATRDAAPHCTRRAILINTGGFFLWERLSGGTSTAEELITSLCEQYSVPHEDAESSVSAFLDVMQKIGYLTATEEESK